MTILRMFIDLTCLFSLNIQEIPNVGLRKQCIDVVNEMPEKNYTDWKYSLLTEVFITK